MIHSLEYLTEVIEELTAILNGFRDGKINSWEATNKIGETLDEVNKSADTLPAGTPKVADLPESPAWIGAEPNAMTQGDMDRMVPRYPIPQGYPGYPLLGRSMSMDVDALIQRFGLETHIPKKGAVSPPNVGEMIQQLSETIDRLKPPPELVGLSIDAALRDEWVNGSWSNYTHDTVDGPPEPGWKVYSITQTAPNVVDGVAARATTEDALGACSEQFDELVRAEVKIIEADAENKRLRAQLSEMRATIKAIRGAINDVEPCADDKVATIEGLIALIQ